MKVDASPSRRNATAVGRRRRDFATTSPPPLRASPTPPLQDALAAASLRSRCGLAAQAAVTNALPVCHHSSSSSVIVVAAKELCSTLRSANLSSYPRHHLLCSPNALDRRASHHRRRGTRLHHRASLPLLTPATIVILARAQAATMEERTPSRRGCQVGEGRLLFVSARGKKTASCKMNSRVDESRLGASEKGEI
ncbi:hypothetical protein LR48_Vigan07g174000 [Vigna angularis]|uniref:Uncharacterized protein n=1 Tax=Phaseolus angularis TaxID=3914 RepID=A0A0L9UZC3_PHAAN|nr:hypothetical protein LR48_Vigan07g174000 [Vigna angularis]